MRALRGLVVRFLLPALGCVALTGCEALAITAFGVGSSTAVGHTLSGITYRTFTAPMPTVRRASLDALRRMGIKATRSESDGAARVIHCAAVDRDIEIRLEPVSASATRMRVIARNGGVFYDSATATEIILQTERGLARS